MKICSSLKPPQGFAERSPWHASSPAGKRLKRDPFNQPYRKLVAWTWRRGEHATRAMYGHNRHVLLEAGIVKPRES